MASPPTLSEPPPPPPSAQPHASLPSLPTLVAHLQSAKRALTATLELVSASHARAHLARRALLRQTALSARCAFLAAGCRRQLARLCGGPAGAAARSSSAVEGAGRAVERAGGEFGAAIAALDEAEERLRSTLGALRGRVCEAALRPKGEREGEGEGRRLVDFVDEEAVGVLLAEIKEGVGAAGLAREGFEERVRAVERGVEEVAERLEGWEAEDEEFWAEFAARWEEEEEEGKRAGEDGFATAMNVTKELRSRNPLRSPTPAALARMEDLAHDAAKNLSSLVQHFDLCVTAVKHTEGGAAAASASGLLLNQAASQEAAAGALLAAQGIDQEHAAGSAGAHTFSSTEDSAPISAEERAELLGVVMNDAGQVDAVVADIKAAAERIAILYERCVEPVTLHLVSRFQALAEIVHPTEISKPDQETNQVAQSNASSFSSHKPQTAASSLPELCDLAATLTAYSAAYSEEWVHTTLPSLHTYAADIDSLATFYDGFLSAYDSLIVEWARRRAANARAEKVALEYARRLDSVWEEERKERERFGRRVGQWLPSDIWTGLREEEKGGGVRWEIVNGKDGMGVLEAARRKEEGDEDDGADESLLIEDSVVREAVMRLKERKNTGQGAM